MIFSRRALAAAAAAASCSLLSVTATTTFFAGGAQQNPPVPHHPHPPAADGPPSSTNKFIRTTPTTNRNLSSSSSSSLQRYDKAAVRASSVATSPSTHQRHTASSVKDQVNNSTGSKASRTRRQQQTTTSQQVSLVDHDHGDVDHEMFSQITQQAWTLLGGAINGEGAGDQFGLSVSISDDGNVVAVGAPQNDGSGGSNSGHVRVYTYIPATGWSQLGDDIDGEAASDMSGDISLSGDGSTLAVGASYNAGNAGSCSGHVRVYRYIPAIDSWTQLGGDIDGETFGDLSGKSVSLSGDGTVVAIGATNNNGSGLTTMGHVRVYKYNPTPTNTWEQIGSDINGENRYDNFGGSVSISSDGSVVAVGARNNDGSGLNNNGHVRVFTYSVASNEWTQLGVDIDGEASDDWSGTSVSLSGDGSVVAIGAPQNNGGGVLFDSGHVRVYKFSAAGNVWTQVGGDIDGGEACFDRFGTSVSLSGDGSVVAVGAPNYDTGGGDISNHSGLARVYKYTATSNVWTQFGGDIVGEAAENYAGANQISLSSDGSVVAVGAYGYSGETGSVRVFKGDPPTSSPSSAPTSSPSTSAPTTRRPSKKPSKKPSRKPTTKPTKKSQLKNPRQRQTTKP